MKVTERLLEDISGMSDSELRKYLLKEGKQVQISYDADDIAVMKRQELLDVICDCLHSDLREYLHSEFKGDSDYSPMHPNETREEFLEHEDK